MYTLRPPSPAMAASERDRSKLPIPAPWHSFRTAIQYRS